jgi:serine/threonine protein kinase
MTDETIFAAALEKADPATRTHYLEEVCAGNPELRQRIENLLRAHDKAGGFLENSPVPAASPANLLTQDLTGPESGSDDLKETMTFLRPSERSGSLGRIGHYEVLEVLGRGGFGIVFRALDETLQRVVAVKVMAPHLAVASPARKRFLREARSSARVRHEHIVQVYAVEEDPIPYLVMEFIPGETLQQRLDRTGPLELEEVLLFGKQIAEGLEAAHAQGLIHRDIKPGNILIESGAQLSIKITDFGLARTADDASLTQSGIIAGTPMYMAPEQAHGDKLDHRADLFSLGSVLYTMCSGRTPFRARSALAVLKRVAEDTPRDIREIIPEVPQWLCDLIARLHAKNPEERIGTAQEVADLLGQGLAALQTGQTESAPVITPVTNKPREAESRIPERREVIAPPDPTHQHKPRKRRWVIALAVFVFLFFVLGPGVFILRETMRRIFATP